MAGSGQQVCLGFRDHGAVVGQASPYLSPTTHTFSAIGARADDSTGLRSQLRHRTEDSHHIGSNLTTSYLGGCTAPFFCTSPIKYA